MIKLTLPQFSSFVEKKASRKVIQTEAGIFEARRPQGARSGQTLKMRP